MTGSSCVDGSDQSLHVVSAVQASFPDTWITLNMIQIEFNCFNIIFPLAMGTVFTQGPAVSRDPSDTLTRASALAHLLRPPKLWLLNTQHDSSVIIAR